MTDLTVPDLLEAIADASGDYVCLVDGASRLTWVELRSRVRRFANMLAESGIGIRNERSALADSESGQDHVALMLRNRAEYLEAMLGSFCARATSFNVNFRYTAGELRSMLADARPSAIVVATEFAPVVGEALVDRDPVVVLQVDDGGDGPLLPGAWWYHDVMAATSDAPGRSDWSPEDLYMLFTGGTTGRPKGVLWRQADALVSAFGISPRDGTEYASAQEAAAAAVARLGRRVCAPTPPFIHGASQWFAIGCLLGGGRVVIPEETGTFRPDHLLELVEQETLTEVMIVGDAFGRPLVEEVERHPRSFPSLRSIVNGGAALSETVRERLLAALPATRIVDNMGSSESGRQASRQFTRAGEARDLEALKGNVVLSSDRTRLLSRGEDELGWLARAGRVPIGYLGDAEKTEATFPTVAGIRYAVPGDRARLRADGMIEFVGRDSSTINTGGEKVFAEEVEEVLRSHPSVRDAIVVGRPSEKWGQEIVAVVAVEDGLTDEELVAHVAVRLARYKLPKRIVRVETVPRTPAGKADLRAAQVLCAGAGEDVHTR